MKILAIKLALAISLLTPVTEQAYATKGDSTPHEIAKYIALVQQAKHAKEERERAAAPKIVVGESNYEKAQAAKRAADIDLLARLVRAEAGGESYAGKVAVAEVVLNRIASTAFPNTLREVIYQRGQFSPVMNGSINRPADADSLRAAEQALTSRHDTQAIYFYNPRTAENRWLDSRPTTQVIGNHTFKK